MNGFKLVKRGKVRELYEIGRITPQDEQEINAFSYETNRYAIHNGVVTDHNGNMAMTLLDKRDLNKIIEASLLGPNHVERTIDLMTGVIK